MTARKYLPSDHIIYSSIKWLQDYFVNPRKILEPLPQICYLKLNDTGNEDAYTKVQELVKSNLS